VRGLKKKFEFNHRFNSVTHPFPCNLIPPKEINLAAYLNSFIGKLAFDTRNKQPDNLFQAQNIIFEIDIDQSMRQTSINMLQVEDDSLSDDKDIPPNKEDVMPQTSPKVEEKPPNPILKIPLRITLDLSNPFYITFGLNGFTLRNCILNFGSPINIMSLNVMKKLGLKLSRKCFSKMILNSDKLKVCGIMEGVKTFLHTYAEKRFSINIVVVEARSRISIYP